MPLNGIPAFGLVTHPVSARPSILQKIQPTKLHKRKPDHPCIPSDSAALMAGIKNQVYINFVTTLE
jgi:hypothetical protein